VDGYATHNGLFIETWQTRTHFYRRKHSRSCTRTQLCENNISQSIQN